MAYQKIEYTSLERKPIIDEGLRDLLPPLDAEAKEALVKDILENGCYSPMICMEDLTLVDGHNRFAICEEYDIPYRIAILHFEDKLAAKQWALDTQKARRNLSTWELGQIALKLKPEIEARAKETMGTRTDLLATLPKGSEETVAVNTRKELAEAAGIGERTMGKIMKIEEEAPEPIREAVEKENISINKGYDITKKLQDVPEDERESAALAMLEEAQTRRTKEVDKKADIAKLYSQTFERTVVMEVSEEAVWTWLEWSGIHPEELPNMIMDAADAADKFTQIKDHLINIQTKDWRERYVIQAARSAEEIIRLETEFEEALDAEGSGAGDAGNSQNGETDQQLGD